MSEILEATVPANQVSAHAATLSLVQDLSSGKLKRDPNCRFKEKKELPKVQDHLIRRFTNKASENLDGATFVHFITGRKVKAQRVGSSRFALEWIGGSKISFASEGELRTEFSRLKE